MTQAKTHDVELNGIPYILRNNHHRMFNASQWAPQVANADSAYRDFSVKASNTKKDWSGGRGDEYAQDPKQFYKSENAATRWDGQVASGHLAWRQSKGTSYPEFIYDDPVTPRSVATGSDSASLQGALAIIGPYFQPADDSNYITFGGMSGVRQGFSQSFTCPVGGHKASRLRIRIKRLVPVADAGSIEIGLANNSSGKPGTTRVSTTIAPTAIGTSWTWVEVTFAENTLTASTVYHAFGKLVSLQNDDCYAWSCDADGSTDAGTASSYDGATWSAYTANDFAYKLGYQHQSCSQEFLVPIGGISVDHLQLLLRRSGIDPGTSIRAEIWTSTTPTVVGGLPSAVFTGGGDDPIWDIDITGIGTSQAWKTTTSLASDAVLTDTAGVATYYHIVVYRKDDGTTDQDTWNVYWGRCASGGYADGRSGYRIGLAGSWQGDSSQDFFFKINDGALPVGAGRNGLQYKSSMFASVGQGLVWENTGTGYWENVGSGTFSQSLGQTISDLKEYSPSSGTDAGLSFLYAALAGTVDSVRFYRINARTTISFSGNTISDSTSGCLGIKTGDTISITGSAQNNDGVRTVTTGGVAGSIVVDGAAFTGESAGASVTLWAKRTITGFKAIKLARLRERLYMGQVWDLKYTENGGVATADWKDSAFVGNATANISGMCEDDGILWISKDDGLYRLVSDTPKEASRVMNWLELMDTKNGRSMLAWQGYLMIPAGHGLFAYDGQTLQSVGLDLDAGLPADMQSKVVALCATLHVLYVATEGSATTKAAIWECDTFKQWHNVWTAPSTGSTIAGLWFSASYAATPRLYWSWGDNVYYTKMPDETDNRATWSGGDFASSCTVEDGWESLGAPNVPKAFVSETIDAKLPTDYQTIVVEVKFDDSCAEATGWHTLGTVAATGKTTLRYDDIVENIGAPKEITVGSTTKIIQLSTTDTATPTDGLSAGNRVVINGDEREVASVDSGIQFTLSTALPVAPEDGDWVDGAGAIGKVRNIRYTLTTPTYTSPVRMFRRTSEYLLRPDPVWAWELSVGWPAHGVYRDGSAYPYTQTQLIAKLRRALVNKTAVPFVDTDSEEYQVFVTSISEQLVASNDIGTDGNYIYEKAITLGLIAA